MKTIKLAFYCDYPFGGSISTEDIVKDIAQSFNGSHTRCEVSYIANGKIYDNKSGNRNYLDGVHLLLREDLFNYKLGGKYKRARFSMKTQLFKNFDINLIFLDRIPTSRFIRSISELESQFVFLFHGIDFKSISFFPLKIKLMRTFNRLIIRQLHKFSDSKNLFFQVLNEHQFSFLVDKGRLPSEKIYLVKNGVHSFQNDIQRDDLSFGIIYLGRINKIPKGGNLLLKIIKETIKYSDPSLKFYIVGTGVYETKLRKEL